MFTPAVGVLLLAALHSSLVVGGDAAAIPAGNTAPSKLLVHRTYFLPVRQLAIAVGRPVEAVEVLTKFNGCPLVFALRPAASGTDVAIRSIGSGGDPSAPFHRIHDGFLFADARNGSLDVRTAAGTPLDRFECAWTAVQADWTFGLEFQLYGERIPRGFDVCNEMNKCDPWEPPAAHSRRSVPPYDFLSSARVQGVQLVGIGVVFVLILGFVAVRGWAAIRERCESPKVRCSSAARPPAAF
ncbi:hypothetical protein M3Y99_00702200 [Aphelenchoides fujianensis]|nr:hypothetical protein M3Y99_00702200 [Aphelenchoides fujianensis]